MLLIRGCILSPSQLIALTRLFGNKLLTAGREFQHSPQYPQVFRMTNQLTENCGCEDWHCDGHFLQDPCAVTVMNMVQAAPGGSISLCDLNAAYDLLPNETKLAVEDLACLNQCSNVMQPLVIRHPLTGLKGLYINMYAQAVERSGKKLPQINSELRQTLSKTCFTHTWQTGDIMIVDNLALAHRACPAAVENTEIMQRAQNHESSAWWRGTTCQRVEQMAISA
jgi:alpha-ketoglutarate-dependent taurine dioxygenase